MNRLERMVDELDPELSARLRALKMRLHHDIGRQLIRQMLRPGEVAVDVGANRGVYTCIMSPTVGHAGRVHAIEPFPGNCARLRTIARRRGNITVHALAVSDHSGSGVHQLDFLDDRFIPYGMPKGYVFDFLFCPPGTAPPPWSRSRREPSPTRPRHSEI